MSVADLSALVQINELKTVIAEMAVERETAPGRGGAYPGKTCC
jgi:hypothetical protein